MNATMHAHVAQSERSTIAEMLSPLKSLGLAVANSIAHLLVNKEASITSFSEVLTDGGYAVTTHGTDTFSAIKGDQTVVVQCHTDNRLTMIAPGFDLQQLPDGETLLLDEYCHAKVLDDDL